MWMMDGPWEDQLFSSIMSVQVNSVWVKNEIAMKKARPRGLAFLFAGLLLFGRLIRGFQLFLCPGGETVHEFFAIWGGD